MTTVEDVLIRYKCLEKVFDRICSRCLSCGFRSTPAFYNFDDVHSVYLCDLCHTQCHSMRSGWDDTQLTTVPKIPQQVAYAILDLAEQHH